MKSLCSILCLKAEAAAKYVQVKVYLTEVSAGNCPDSQSVLTFSQLSS